MAAVSSEIPVTPTLERIRALPGIREWSAMDED
jgi:hypothetical protein